MSITAGSGVEAVPVDTPALGDRSYLAHDGSVALVVDPQRDIDRVDAADRTVVAINDDYDRAAKAGLPVVTPEAAVPHAGLPAVSSTYQ